MRSLQLGQEFKEKHDLKRVHFLQMNLFNPIFKKNSFPIVICNGVLHHTSKPLAGFQSIANLVKPGGYIIIGLYNKYGRLWTNLRQYIFKMTKDRFKTLNPNFDIHEFGIDKKNAWFADQYKNPHESKHTLKEVLDWFKDNNFTFVKSIPSFRLGSSLDTEQEGLFNYEPPAAGLERWITEVSSPLIQEDEGGLFIMIGKKKFD